MDSLEQLLHNNKAWAQQVKEKEPAFFDQLAGGQSPEFLWIGCADSRVPASQVLGLMPGEVFVHRNVANLVVHTDLNCLTVLNYAVDVLKVKHVLVVGHYGCGGVKAAYDDGDTGMIDNWLRNIKDVQRRHQAQLDECGDADAQVDRLVELNVQEQVAHVGQTSIVQNAWARGQSLCIHGWVYNLKDGLLRDLDCSLSGPDQLESAYRLNAGG